MKIYFEYPFKDGPWGGGNQFLKALRDNLKSEGLVCQDPKDSNVIIFNAHQNFQQVLHLKQRFPDKTFVHRMDGLYKLYNSPNDDRQDLNISLNKRVADLTVFQTEWALNEYIKEGFDIKRPYAVIVNAPNCDLFKPPKSKLYGQKTRLVCTSWSINKNKGFHYYKYLDINLDFNKYSFTYIGKDPGIKFKNIKKIGPFDSLTLAKHLREYDIFITGSKYECCSNSLLEALSSGLPAVGLNSGGTPEIIKNAGELFNSEDEIISCINKVSNDISVYSSRIDIKNIDQITKEYIFFFKKLINE